MYKTRLLTLASILVLSLGLTTTALAAANLLPFQTSPANLPAADWRAAIGNGLLAAIPSDRLAVRLYYTSQANLDTVAGRLDIWEVHKKEQYVVAGVSNEEFQWLQGLGYRLEVDAGKTALFGVNAALDPRYYYYDNYVSNSYSRYMKDFLQDINAAYPNLTELIDAGNAWQANHGGYARDIWVLRITNEDPAYGDIADKPVFFLYANTHAREVATPELAIRYIHYLLDGYNGEGGYGQDADVTWMVNHHAVYVLVSQNPDGHVVNEQNTSANRRKNMNNSACGSGTFGVDLNRNHSFLWGCCGGSSSNACDETYRGVAAASEPEVQAFQSYFATIVPDQNGPNGNNTIAPASPITTTGVMLSLHSYSDVILWPWYLTGYPAAPNAAQLETIGRKLAFFNGYSPDGTIGYTVDGATDYWTYGKLGIASFTIEVGGAGYGSCDGFFPQYGCIDGIDGMSRNFWADNKPAFIYLTKIAATPYLTAYGPDALGLTLTPAVAAPSQPVTLTATIADRRYGGDTLKPIAAAEYFIDAPGADGSGTPMSVSDGAWGGTSENVQATLDTTGLSIGQHYILVHGMNNENVWGPFTAIFLYVAEPGVSPVIEGYVRDGVTNAPIAATVSAGDFQAVTDPNTGYYAMPVISGTYTLNVTLEGYKPVSAANVHAVNYQTVRQDFYPLPLCIALNDDVEGGNVGWTVQSPWAISTESAHSPTHAWSDSPAANYGNNINTSLTSPVLNLSGYTGTTLSFWHTYATEAGYDYAYVEYSTNGGTTWSQARSYNGMQGEWNQVSIQLSQLNNRNNVRLRFRLQSDSGVVADGWHLDDILLYGDTWGCHTPLAPTAEFTSTQLIPAGEALQFHDLTIGTAPLTYAWDFGDGTGTSNDSNPRYTYTTPGTYTVTLSVSNAQGSSSVSHTVTVYSPNATPISAVELSQLSTGVIRPGQMVSYTADILPNWASMPYSYTLSFGDSTAPITASASADPLIFNHTFAVSGTFQLAMSAWNSVMTQPVTASLTTEVVTYTHGVTISPLSQSATALPGEAVTYTLTITNLGEISETFSISNAGQHWPVQLSTQALGPLPPGDNASLTITVSVPLAAGGGESDSLLVLVSAPHVAPAQAVFTTTAASVYGLSVSVPLDAQQGMRGQTLTYTLELTNSGNTTDTFDVVITGTWPVSVTTSAGVFDPEAGIVLGRGGEVTLTLSVAIPAEALNGSVEVTEITLRSRNAPQHAVQVNLTSTAAWRSLYLPFITR